MGRSSPDLDRCVLDLLLRRKEVRQVGQAVAPPLAWHPRDAHPTLAEEVGRLREGLLAQSVM